MDLPVTNGTEPVPVYDCHVIIRKDDSDGRLYGRVTNLPGLAASAASERDLLRQLADAFKAEVIRYREGGREVPWSEKKKPGEGEYQRWIPVHL